MKNCIECRYSMRNHFNNDIILCTINHIQRSCETECCVDFMEKLTEEELIILDLFKKKIISIEEYEKYTGLKQQIFEGLMENGCITGKGIDRPSHCYVQEEMFKKNYPNICAHNRQDR